MKAFMGFTFFLLFLAGIILATMLGDQSAQKNMLGGGASLTGVTWHIASLGDEVVPGNSGIFINFEVEGSINGNTGCNAFHGSLVRSESGLSVSPLATTKKACPAAIMGREDDFLAAIQKIRQFQGGGDSMLLLDEKGRVLAEFVTATQ